MSRRGLGKYQGRFSKDSAWLQWISQKELILISSTWCSKLSSWTGILISIVTMIQMCADKFSVRFRAFRKKNWHWFHRLWEVGRRPDARNDAREWKFRYYCWIMDIMVCSSGSLRLQNAIPPKNNNADFIDLQGVGKRTDTDFIDFEG